MMIPSSWYLALCSLVALFGRPVQADLDKYYEREVVEHEMPLEPFQILYTTSSAESFAFSTMSMDGMSLLEATRSHIENCLDEDPFFLRLTMYFSIRSKDLMMFQNGTKVAYVGNAYYTLPAGVMDEKEIAQDTLLCFLGKNESNYVYSLKSMGWDHVERAEIMTIAGDMIEYVDGGMVVVSGDAAAAEEEPKEMGDDTSMLIILLAIFVPLSFLILVGGVCCLYRMCHNVSCRKSKAVDANNPIWEANNPMSSELRAATLRKENLAPSENPAAEDTHDAESDRASAKADIL